MLNGILKEQKQTKNGTSPVIRMNGGEAEFRTY